MMHQMKTRVLGLVLAAGCLSSAASAQIAQALDRVSPDTPIVIGIRDLSELSGDLKRWAGVVAPPEAAMQLGMAEQMLSLPGLNAEGSAAIALSFEPGGEEPVPAIVLPVQDYDAFVEAMQGNPADAVAALNMMGDTVYAKSLGDGYAVISPEMERVEGFAGTAGQLGEHRARMGELGHQAAEGADVFVLVDIQSIRPVLEAAMVNARQQAEFAAMMAGEAAAAQIEAMLSAAETFMNDGRTAVLGMGMGEAGVWLDFAGQFEEGSDTGEVFAGSGDAPQYMTALPNIDYIFAMAADFSAPGIRGLLRQFGEMSQGISMGFNSERLIELNDGQAMVIGKTPGLFAGGLFTNSVQFTASSKPQELLEATREAIAEMDGLTEQGMVFSTSYQEDAAEVAGRSVDAWGFTMAADPNHQDAMAATMGIQQMTMLFGGQAGPSGYMVGTDRGVISTFAKNSRLLERTLQGESSMAANEMLSAAAEHLPENRTAEFYLNIKGVIDMVAPMMGAMMPGADLSGLPEQMHPIALGVSTGDSGMHARLFVPGDVLEFAGSMAQQFGGEGEWEDEIEDEPADRPRF